MHVNVRTSTGHIVCVVGAEHIVFIIDNAEQQIHSSIAVKKFFWNSGKANNGAHFVLFGHTDNERYAEKR